MAVYVSNLVINCGTDFFQTFNLTNTQGDTSFNLTNYSIASKLKKHPASSSSTAFTATISNAANGTVGIALTSGQTAALKPGRYVYDIVITSSTGYKTRVIEGNALVREGVTT
jgi:hypothetical protein